MSNFQAWYNVSIFASLYSSEYQGYSLEKHAHLPFRKSMTRFQNHKGDSIRKKSWVYLSASDPMSSPTEKNTWNAWNGRANLELWPWFFVLCLKLHLVGVPNKSKKCTYSIWREESSYWATFLGHHGVIQPGAFRPLRALGTKTRQKLDYRFGKSMRKIKKFPNHQLQLQKSQCSNYNQL